MRLQIELIGMGYDDLKILKKLAPIINDALSNQSFDEFEPVYVHPEYVSLEKTPQEWYDRNRKQFRGADLMGYFKKEFFNYKNKILFLSIEKDIYVFEKEFALRVLRKSFRTAPIISLKLWNNQ